MAVRLLKPSERGIGNGIQKAGGFLGLMLGGGGGLLAYHRWGWASAMVLLAALTAAPLPLLLAYREQGAPDVSRRHKVSMRTLVGFFHQPGAVRWAFAVLPLYLAGIAVAYPLVTLMLVDYGWPLDTIGTVWIIGGGAVAMVAALAAGGLLSAIRRRPALIGLAVIQLAAIAALLLVARSTGGALVGLAAVVLLSGAYAAVGTAVYTINMDWSRTDSPGLLRAPMHAGRGRGRHRASRNPRLHDGPHRGRASRPGRRGGCSPSIPRAADRSHAPATELGHVTGIRARRQPQA
jgi:predicted MFS family arabinose efflux permease